MLLPEALAIDLTAPLSHLAAHGYARLGRALSEAGLSALRERADDLMLGRARGDFFFQLDADSGRYEDLRFGDGYVGPSLRYRKIEKLERDPRFLAWISNPLFGRICGALIAGGVALYRAVLMTKAAGGGTALPWHQDGGRFWGVDPPPRLQIWTALDDAPEDAGCVEVLPASHLAGLATPEGGVIPEALLREREAPLRALPLPAAAGEVLLIDNHVWHRSGVNHTARPRRALSVCYMSAATRCLRKKHSPRAFVRVFP
jgi:phytanoyl-CoA hydroxylase